jgi:signal transduction histidine kinase
MNISDNGKGFDRELKAADLKSIQNRLRLIQGQLEVKSSKTWKTIIGVKIPC